MRLEIAVTLIVASYASSASAAGRVTLCREDVEPGPGLNLATALQYGGSVTFDCPYLATIRITREHELRYDVEIDGSGVTLASEPRVRIFRARASSLGGPGPADHWPVKVTLRNITLRGANAIIFGGIFSGPAATLRLDNVAVISSGRAGPRVAGVTSGHLIRARTVITERATRFYENAGAVLAAENLQLSDTDFYGNAGPPFVGDQFVTGQSATIEDCSFTENEQAVWRGAIEIRRSTFSQNGRGSPRGGALAIHGPVALIEKTRFFQNRAQNGGAIWLRSGVLTIRRGAFDQNVATDGGGAIAVDDGSASATLDVVYSHFRDNRARDGGGVLLQRGAGSARTLRGHHVSFARNHASAKGGGILAERGVVDLAFVFLVANKTEGYGGAIVGGTESSDTTRLANALVVRNEASVGGAYAGSTLELINATIADNRGGALALRTPSNPGTRGALALSNTILTNNAGGTCRSIPPRIRVEDNGNNLQFPLADCHPAIAVADPKLDSFYVPILGSPAASAGNPQRCSSAPVSARDVFGTRRPQGPRCAIGAVEGTIERHAIDKLRAMRPETRGPLAEFLRILETRRR